MAKEVCMEVNYTAVWIWTQSRLTRLAGSMTVVAALVGYSQQSWGVLPHE